MRPWTKVRSEYALARKHGADESTLAELREELRTSRLFNQIERAVADLPPLNAEQRATLARLVSVGGSE